VGRTSALLILSAALVAWYELVPHLAARSTWWSVGVVAIVLMPAMFAVELLALPARNHRRLPWAVVVLAVLAIVLGAAHASVFANFAKFAAVTGAGWLFLRLFEELAWAVLVALVIPWVDAYSVWRGPTKSITEHHAAVFTKLSVAFVVPGGGAARIGLPDVFFFALFLAASARFGLRTFWTWLTMVAGLGVTIALTTFWSTGGLPALPAISLGFLLPNADLVWRRLRGQPGLGDGPQVPLDRAANR
jgi:hypothetical protein